MTTELWESDDPQLRIGLSTLNLNFENLFKADKKYYIIEQFFKADKKYYIFIVLNHCFAPVLELFFDHILKYYSTVLTS